MTKKILNVIALVLAIIGSINWGLVGLLDLNVVEAALGSIPVLVTIIYVLVGVAGLYLIYYVAKK